MMPAPRIPRAQVVALSQPVSLSLPSNEWLYTAAALVLIIGGLFLT